MHFLGIDVGGTKVEAAAVEDGVAIDPQQVPTDLDSSEALLDGLEELAQRVIAAHGEPAAIGVGVPSQIDFATGTVISSVNIPLEGVPLRDELERRFGVQVYVDNDANCAGLAEAQLVDGGPARHLVMLTLGTGVGGGVVIDGSVFRGATGLGAELGHMVVNAHGPECPGKCPNRGCLEAYCSGVALARAAKSFAAGHSGCRLAECLDTDGEVSGIDVVRLARDGDEDSSRLLDELGTWLGVGIASFVNIFEPQHIVIGGGLGEAADLFLDTAVAEARSRALPPGFERVSISLAQGGPDAGVLGAGLLAMKEYTSTYAEGDTAPSPTVEGGR
ncbi:MAG: ROK family protein [Thermoleophilaceae bacterium]